MGQVGLTHLKPLRLPSLALRLIRKVTKSLDCTTLFCTSDSRICEGGWTPRSSSQERYSPTMPQATGVTTTSFKVQTLCGANRDLLIDKKRVRSIMDKHGLNVLVGACPANVTYL